MHFSLPGSVVDIVTGWRQQWFWTGRRCVRLVACCSMLQVELTNRQVSRNHLLLVMWREGYRVGTAESGQKPLFPRQCSSLFCCCLPIFSKKFFLYYFAASGGSFFNFSLIFCYFVAVLFPLQIFSIWDASLFFKITFASFLFILFINLQFSFSSFFFFHK